MRRTDSTSSLPGSSGLSKQWPHLYHYVSHLLAAAAAQEVSRPAASAALAPGSAWPTAASLQQQQQQPTSQLAQHPLSVSSSGSGSSSEEDSDKDRPASTSARKHSTADSQRSEASSSSRSPKPASSVTSTSENASVVSSRKSPRSAFAPVAAAAAVGGAAPPGLSRTISSSSSIRSTGPPSPLIPTGVTPPAKAVSQSEKEELLKKVIDLLENEREEECKKVIEDALGQMGKDAVMVDQICLDLMHKHKGEADASLAVRRSTSPLTCFAVHRRRRSSTLPADADLDALTRLSLDFSRSTHQPTVHADSGTLLPRSHSAWKTPIAGSCSQCRRDWTRLAKPYTYAFSPRYAYLRHGQLRCGNRGKRIPRWLHLERTDVVIIARWSPGRRVADASATSATRWWLPALVAKPRPRKADVDGRTAFAFCSGLDRPLGSNWSICISRRYSERHSPVVK